MSFVALGKSYNLSEPPVSSCVEGVNDISQMVPLILSQNETTCAKRQAQSPSATWFSDSEVMSIHAR